MGVLGATPSRFFGHEGGAKRSRAHGGIMRNPDPAIPSIVSQRAWIVFFPKCYVVGMVTVAVVPLPGAVL